MTLEQAYAILGFKPLDEFIKHQMDFNMHGIPPQDKSEYSGQSSFRHRGIGATTWMLVSAVLHMEKGDVLIVAHSTDWQRKLQNRMEEIVKGLHFPCGWERRNSTTALTARGHFAYFTTNQSNQEARVVANATKQGTPFEDVQWKLRAIRRSEGPFGMVREIRLRDGTWEGNEARYLAYAEWDEFLFETTEEGALDLLQKYPEIRTTGWEPPKPPKFPLKMGERGKPNLQQIPKKPSPIAGVPGRKPLPVADAATKAYVDKLMNSGANFVNNATEAQPGDLYYDALTGKVKLLTKSNGWIEVRDA